MIQRIQSIYYLVAALLSIVLFAQPFAIFTVDAGVFEVYACHLNGPANHNVDLETLPLTISLTLASLLSFVAIFMYKNRKLQMRIGKLSLFLFFVSIGFMGAFYWLMQGVLETSGDPGFAAVFALVSLIFVWLANRAVKRDDNLVKSADRIR